VPVDDAGRLGLLPPRRPGRAAAPRWARRPVTRTPPSSPRTWKRWSPQPRFKAHHLESLLPRLQAECAAPQALAELLAACTRAQDRWEHRVAELDTLQGLNSELAFQGYPDTFKKARRCSAA
jgi:hypothetical protein